MIVFAGRISFDNEPTSRACAAILEAQEPTGRTCSIESATFGGSDDGPLIGGGGRLLLVGGVRLDYREELGERLGFAPAALRAASDLELALAAWERWSEEALRHFRGDFAFAVWASDRRKLTFARGPLSASQLFYCCLPDGIAFASSAQGLCAAGETDQRLDFSSAAQFIGGVGWPSESTWFANTSRLRQGQVLRADQRGLSTEESWRPERNTSHLRTDFDQAEHLRELLDRAVMARLRRQSGLAAAHLSSGRDSGAVATSAALGLKTTGESLLAYTAAPRAGFAGSGLPMRCDDESEHAAATARLYRNIRHHVIRPDRDPFAEVTAVHACLPGPIATLSNFQWDRDIRLAAAAAGATVLLTGGVGNLTISAGGPWYLPSLLREAGMARWWGAAQQFVREPRDLARVFNWTFGGLIPPMIHRRISNGASASGLWPTGLPLLSEAHRKTALAAVERQFDRRPPRDPFIFRREMLLDQDPTNVMTRLWGIDARDPTADRELIDFCFTIPSRLLIGPPGSSPMFDAAFGDRLGWRRGQTRARGYQGADWYLSFTRDRVRDTFEESRGHPLVGELLDMEHIDQLLNRWPDRWNDVSQMLHYRNNVLRAVSAANYITTNF